MSDQDEILRGYLDGFDANSPEPGPNTSLHYRHGFRNGRDDLSRMPTRTAQEARNDLAKLEPGS